MSILTKAAPTAEERLRAARIELMDTQRELSQVKAERDAYRDQLEGRKDLMWWVQAKVNRQQKALHLLNQRVVNQRFQLHVLEELGRGLTRDEFLAAKATLENEQVKELVGEPA